MAIFAMLLGLCSMYLAYAITRIMNGAPKAWYVVIVGFALRFLYTAYQVYLDLETPADTLGIERTSVDFVIQVIFAFGLFMLYKTFQRVRDIKRLEGEERT